MQLLSVNKWIWVYLFIHIPSCVFTMYITLLVYVMLVPICARSGVINSDLYMGVVTSLATLYVISFIVSIKYIQIKKKFFLNIFFSDSVNDFSQETTYSLYIFNVILCYNDYNSFDYSSRISV